MSAYERGTHAPAFRVLSHEQIDRLYAATLECMSRTGLHIHNAEARDLLARAGAAVDGIRVRIPPEVIRETVATTPRSFTLWARPSEDGVARAAGLDLQVAPDRTYFGAGPTCTYFMDPVTHERRKARRGDPTLTALVSDALENIDYVMGLALIDDVPHHLAPVYEFAEMVINTAKPVLPWAYNVDNVRDIYDIGLAVAGSEQALRDRPFFGLFVTFQSPLIQTDEDLANAFWAAERGIPVVIIGGGAAGTSAPVTGAGALVISLAGALAMLAIIQLRQPGAPVCIGGVPQAMDLRTARPCYGGPEMSLYSAAMAEVARELGLPFMSTSGASESKVLDLQAAIESTFETVISGMSAAALIHDVGFLDCADIGSLESLVMNDEIISMTRRLMRGIEVNDDTLMLGLIDKIGPGGEFVSTKETARRCRREIWNPTLFDRQAWVMWEAEGSKDTLDRIRERLQAILGSHRPPALPAGSLERIEEILAQADPHAGFRKGSAPSTDRTLVRG